MKTALLLAMLGVSPINTSTGKQDDILLAYLCFLRYEERSGLNKICYYNCLGSKVAITVKSHQLCPINIER